MSRAAKVVDLAERRALRAFLKVAIEASQQFPLWKLDADRRPVSASIIEWGEWKARHPEEWIVAKTQVGQREVSTVFIGTDMNHARIINPKLKPLLFETMIFGPGQSDIVDRYSTWEEAERGHAAAVKEATDAQGNDDAKDVPG